MRTNIEIDDKLMDEALRVSKAKTKNEAVEEGLRWLIRMNQQVQIRSFRGKLAWTGDLDQMRSDD